MLNADKITIRSYCPEDREHLIALLKLNIPAFFAPEEEGDFKAYLDSEVELYYVLLYEDVIVGSGGINFAENKTIGKLSWDLLHPMYQGKALGGRLAQHRIHILKNIETVTKITVRTSQLVYKFYEKQGFKLVECIADYWAPGFDLYAMVYEEPI